MKLVSSSTKFRKNYKKHLAKIPELEDDFEIVATMLAQGIPLPKEYGDHKLNGKYRGYRDFHIYRDLVVVYKITEQEVIFKDIGTHSYFKFGEK